MPTEVKGAIRARKVLKEFNPDLLKEIQKEMRDALKPIVTQAKGFIPIESPMRGWRKTDNFWSYDSADMRRGISYSLAPSRANEQGFKSIAQIMNKTAMGSIWETAKNPQPWVGPKGGLSKKYSRSSNKSAGQQFINNLEPGVNSSQVVISLT